MKFRKHRKDMVQVNLTPLIDVVFLLLIFFMVSTSFTRENQLQINLPEADAEPATQTDQNLSLLVSADGGYAVNGRTLANNRIATLMDALRIEAGEDYQQSLVVLADADASHQAVVTAMDAAGRLGFVNLRISTRQPSSDP